MSNEAKVEFVSIDEMPSKESELKWGWLYDALRNLKADGKALRVKFNTHNEAERARSVVITKQYELLPRGHKVNTSIRPRARPKQSSKPCSLWVWLE